MLTLDMSPTAAPAPDLDDDARWAAVLARDARQDGRFFYGVRTTGVFCRPSCPSRRPRRENVRFFDDVAAARAAGFRACQRCRPESDTPAHAAAVERACRQLERSESIPRLAALARDANLSPHHFHRVFRAATGLTPRGYAAACRAARLREGLGASTSITTAMYDAGFNSSSRFYENSAALLGMTPGAWRKGGDQTRIRFALGDCALGTILVAATANGLCAISLGDDPQVLLVELQTRFPQAELVGGDAEFERWVSVVVGFVEAPALGLDLPLDIRGTAFQQRVWQALREIPCGETVSYAEIARRLGMPSASRAVATACAANTLAVAIPCHRVVRQDGGLSGYRWGVARKRRLLDSEQGAP